MLPKSIKIGAVNYAVSEERDLHTFDNEWKKEFLNGQIVYSDATLKVKSDLSHDVKVCALWHELIHGILNNAGQIEHTEEHVIALGYGLVQVIRDNPELVKYTLGETDAS